MGLLAKDGGNGDYEQLPAGTHLAICYLLADIGHQDSAFGVKQKVVIGWELPHEKMQDGRPFGCSKMYTLSLNEKANLRHDLEAWRSRQFTQAELDGFDLTAILGKPCQVTIVHEVKGDKTYSNVASVTAVAKGMIVPERHNDLVTFDMDDPSRKGYDKLPQWIQKRIDAAVPVTRAGPGHDERNPPDEALDDSVPF